MDSQNKRSSWQKRVLIWGFFIELAIGVALIFGSIYLYHSRPRAPEPWNRSAIKAYSESINWIARGPELYVTPVFNYILENTTDSDYRLDANDVGIFSVKLEGLSDLLSNPEESPKIDLPIFLPAGHKISIKVELNRPLHGLRYMEMMAPVGKERLVEELNRQYPDLAGFTLFDTHNRYQIEFPKDW
jgi:hypothetical protein